MPCNLSTKLLKRRAGLNNLLEDKQIALLIFNPIKTLPLFVFWTFFFLKLTLVKGKRAGGKNYWGLLRKNYPKTAL